MASEKISQFPDLTAVASGDFFPVVDISEADPYLQNKKVQIGALDARYVNADGDTVAGTYSFQNIVIPSGGSLTLADGADATGLPDTTQLINRSIPEINLNLVRGDSWDGFYMYLQEPDGTPSNLTDSTVSASARTSTYAQITPLNATIVGPASGYVRIWGSSAQTGQLPVTSGQQVFWEVSRVSNSRVATVSGFTNSASGTLSVITTTYPGVSSYDNVFISGALASGLPANTYNVLYPTTTSGQDRLNLITSTPPYSFAIPQLSTSGTSVAGTGVYPTGVSLYQRRTDTMVRGIIFVTLP